MLFNSFCNVITSISSASKEKKLYHTATPWFKTTLQLYPPPHPRQFYVYIGQDYRTTVPQQEHRE